MNESKREFQVCEGDPRNMDAWSVRMLTEAEADALRARGYVCIHFGA